MYRATTAEQQQRLYTQLVQALNAAQSPLDALAVLEVKLFVFVQMVLPVTGGDTENQQDWHQFVDVCSHVTEQATRCVISNKMSNLIGSKNATHIDGFALVVGMFCYQSDQELVVLLQCKQVCSTHSDVPNHGRNDHDFTCG